MANTLDYISWVLPQRDLLKTYVRLTTNNDGLASLALLHIHRDFCVNIDKVQCNKEVRFC